MGSIPDTCLVKLIFMFSAYVREKIFQFDSQSYTYEILVIALKFSGK